MGLLLALQFNATIARDVVSAANGEGILLNPVLPDAIRFMPPLIITEADAEEAVDKLERAITKALAAS
jgi:acetylornithine/succinyldiaminopimelate/putrescine aminotransferase